MTKKAFLFFGKSGAGKGTQAKLLRDYLEKNGETVLYIETGNLFREFSKGDSLSAKNVSTLMSTGSLLPEFLPITMWGNSLLQNYTGNEILILDGLARRQHESPILDSAMRFFDIQEKYVIYINVSHDWAHQRLFERKRSDDTEEDILKRLDWFEWNTVPAMAFFHENDEYRFLEINGEQTIQEVHADIVSKIK